MNVGTNVGTVALAFIVLVCIVSFVVCARRAVADDRREELEREVVR